MKGKPMKDWIHSLNSEWQKLFHTDIVVSSVFRRAMVEGWTREQAMEALALAQTKAKDDYHKALVNLYEQSLPPLVVPAGELTAFEKSESSG